MAEFVDNLVGDADRIEVHDLAAGASGDDVDHSGEEGVVAVVAATTVPTVIRSGVSASSRKVHA